MLSISDFRSELIDGVRVYNIVQILDTAHNKLGVTKKSKIDLWLRKNSTKELIDKICAEEDALPAGLVVRKRGRFGGGTWVHPKLAEDFISYLNNVARSVRT